MLQAPRAGGEEGAEMLPDSPPDSLPTDLDKKLDSGGPGTKNLGGDKAGNPVKKTGNAKESDLRPPAKPPRPPATKEPSTKEPLP